VSQNRLNGSIPNCIGSLKVLQKWESRGNSLSGTIPAAFGSLPVLQGLFLSDNKLSGTIPSEIFNAKRIEQLLLSYNDLEGTVPKIFSRLGVIAAPPSPCFRGFKGFVVGCRGLRIWHQSGGFFWVEISAAKFYTPRDGNPGPETLRRLRNRGDTFDARIKP